MDCETCRKCDKNFDRRIAEEHAAKKGVEPCFDTCVGCLEKSEKEVKKEEELKMLKDRISELERELAQEKQKRAAPEQEAGGEGGKTEAVDLTGDAEPSPRKKQKMISNIWVITKADLPGFMEKVASCEILGTFSSKKVNSATFLDPRCAMSGTDIA